MEILNISSSDDFKKTILFNFRESNPLADLERIFPGRIEDFACDLSWLYSNLNRVLNHNQDAIPELQMYFAFLTWKCCNTVSGAIETFGRGYVTEAIALLRNVIESIFVILHVSKKPEIYGRLKAGAYNATESVGPAKDDLPIAGKLYGLLSGTFNHFNYDATGTPAVTGRDGRPSALLIGGGFDINQKRNYTVLIAYIDLTLIILRDVVERTFHDFVTDFQYWKKENGALISNLGPAAKAKQDQLVVEITRVKWSLESGHHR